MLNLLNFNKMLYFENYKKFYEKDCFSKEETAIESDNLNSFSGYGIPTPQYGVEEVYELYQLKPISVFSEKEAKVFFQNTMLKENQFLENEQFVFERGKKDKIVTIIDELGNSRRAVDGTMTYDFVPLFYHEESRLLIINVKGVFGKVKKKHITVQKPVEPQDAFNLWEYFANLKEYAFQIQHYDRQKNKKVKPFWYEIGKELAEKEKVNS